VGIVGLLKNTLKINTKKGITKSTSPIPAFIGNCRTVEKIRPNTKKGITKEQHITQSCFIGGIG
jgi:hypothetical protein